MFAEDSKSSFPMQARDFRYRRPLEAESTNAGGSIWDNLGRERPEGTKRTQKRQFYASGVEIRNENDGFLYGSGNTSTRTSPPLRKTLYSKTSADIKRTKKQHEEAAMDIATRKQVKLQQESQYLTDKKKDLEMLQNYNPWGKPAPGAPRLSQSGTLNARKGGQVEEDSTNISDEFPYGRPGGGAPRKSESGKTLTTLPRDKDTRFQMHLQKEVHDSLRYSRGHQGEREHTHMRRPQNYVEDSGLREEEYEKRMNYSRRLEEQIMEKQERQLQEKKEKKQMFEVFDPFGKDHPIRDKSGKVVSHKKTLVGKMALDVHEENGRKDSFFRPPLDATRFKRGSMKEHTFDGYDPWGRPGCGAPITNDNGRVVTNRSNLLNENDSSNLSTKNKKLMQEEKIYGDTLREGMDRVSERRRLEAASINGSNGEDKALWIHSGATGRPTVGNGNQMERDSKYYKDLQEQAALRHQTRMREREDEKRLARKHFQTFENIWEPGQPAPQPARQPLAMDTKFQEKREKYRADLEAQIHQRRTDQQNMITSNLEEDRKHIRAYNQQWRT